MVAGTGDLVVADLGDFEGLCFPGSFGGRRLFSPPVDVVPQLEVLLSDPVLLVEPLLCCLFGLPVLFPSLLVVGGLWYGGDAWEFNSLSNMSLLGVCPVTA